MADKRRNQMAQQMDKKVHISYGPSGVRQI